MSAAAFEIFNELGDCKFGRDRCNDMRVGLDAPNRVDNTTMPERFPDDIAIEQRFNYGCDQGQPLFGGPDEVIIQTPECHEISLW